MKRHGSLALLSGLFLVGMVSFQAQAKISVTGIDNASSVDWGSTIIVYGGTSGSSAGCSGTSTCNNCDDAVGTLAACNKRRINQNTIIRIYMASDAKDGKPTVAKADGSVLGAQGNSVSKGTAGYVDVTWGNVCGQILSTFTDCETSSGIAYNGAVALTVGIDANADTKLDSTNDDVLTVSFKVEHSMGDTVSTLAGSSTSGENGIYGFSVYPGDSKVYVENLSAHSGFPASATVQYTKMHLLYSAATTCTANLFSNSDFNTGPTKDIQAEFGSDGQLNDNRFFGLTNETSYMFKVALEDQAGNLGLFTADADCLNTKHIAMPGELFGLLRDQQNCFVATAAFGSPLSQYVQVFRKFRDVFLVPNQIGRKVVLKYYDLSPQAAKYIGEHEWIRTLVRGALYPIWIFAEMALNWGLAAAFAIFGGSFFGLVWLMRKFWKRREIA